MIEVRELRKSYSLGWRKRVEAVRGVSFCCHPGEVFGLIGPNGAGKTTTLRIISTALKPTSGGGEVMGFDLEREPNRIREQIGFLSSNTGLYGRLTAREVLTYFGRLHRMEKDRIQSRIEELADVFWMREFLDRACDKLSSGMRQKVNIARAVLHSPPAMVFDEPTTGLDVLTSHTIMRFIQRCRERGRTVIFSTHVMSEVERLCDRVAVIHQGQLLFTGTPAEMREKWGDDLSEAFVAAIEADPVEAPS